MEDELRQPGWCQVRAAVLGGTGALRQLFGLEPGEGVGRFVEMANGKAERRGGRLEKRSEGTVLFQIMASAFSLPPVPEMAISRTLSRRHVVMVSSTVPFLRSQSKEPHRLSPMGLRITVTGREAGGLGGALRRGPCYSGWR